MNIVKPNLPMIGKAATVNTIVILICCTLATNLFTYGFAQKVFYIAAYLSGFLFIYTLASPSNRMRMNRYILLLFSALFIMGALRFGWAVYINDNYANFTTPTNNILNNYRLGGKRLMLAAFVVAVIAMYNDDISENTIYISKAMIWLGVSVALLFGIHEYLQTGKRIKLTADGASSSSYMVMFLYCTYLWLSIKDANRKWIFADASFAVIILSLIILSGTRVSLLAFMFITLCQISRFYGLLEILRPKRNRLYALILFVILAGLTSERWKQGISDIEDYSSNSSTSVGARVAIWDSGIHFLPQHLGFSSPDVRTVTAREYIARVHPGNAEGYANVKYNMHNEFLEIATLQGILGVAIFILFYAAALFIWFKRHALMGISMPVAALFIMGMTDSVLIYSPTSMLFTIAVALCTIQPKQHKA
ncbi:O-antigen ligase [Pantoea sp. RIT-PI-b]|uniref:O-antigen ligase family protein n=1 Tax=Pantoea sp. RIT-PI-b TaxID=1681195 RepID=UPI000676458E|nr:O-antigen ligase family protein [Pantoea sp. RIT-PI-b]